MLPYELGLFLGGGVLMRSWLFALLACCASLTAFGQDPGVSDVPAGANPSAGQGGGSNADFDSLIDLIVSTVATESWAENGGGEAEIRPFPSGVYVDAEGVLQTAGVDRERCRLASDATQVGGNGCAKVFRLALRFAGAVGA